MLYPLKKINSKSICINMNTSEINKTLSEKASGKKSQSEISQKEKNKYHILTHICGIRKTGIDNLIYKENRCSCREQMYGSQGEKGRLDELRGWD